MSGRQSTPSPQVPYLGLADLGKTVTASPGEVYDQVGDTCYLTPCLQDGDNYLDICVDLAHQPAVLEADLAVSLHCDLDQV